MCNKFFYLFQLVCVLNAQNFTVDCDGDGVLDVCSVDECPPCSKLKPNPSSLGMKCCGDKEYDPASKACCPNGNQIIDDPEHMVSEWCADCSYVEDGTDYYYYCCDSKAGKARRKQTVACLCYNCNQKDCTSIDWKDYLISVGTGAGKGLGTIISLAIQNGELVAMANICWHEVCPDTEC